MIANVTRQHFLTTFHNRVPFAIFTLRSQIPPKSERTGGQTNKLECLIFKIYPLRYRSIKLPVQGCKGWWNALKWNPVAVRVRVISLGANVAYKYHYSETIRVFAPFRIVFGVLVGVCKICCYLCGGK